MITSTRIEPRLKLALPITGEWLTRDGYVIRTNLLTYDISYTGLAFILERSSENVLISPADRIDLKANHRRFSATGTACYVLESPTGTYRVGVNLDKPLFVWLSRYKSCHSSLMKDFLPVS